MFGSFNESMSDIPSVCTSMSWNHEHVLVSLTYSISDKKGNCHSCMYLQSLLRDRLFKIKTDHRNLLFIKEASNPMIVRWYMALSEFRFTLEFIPGVDNNIADAMSRLCRNNMVDEPKEYTEEQILSAISASTKPNKIQ